MEYGLKMVQKHISLHSHESVGLSFTTKLTLHLSLLGVIINLSEGEVQPRKHGKEKGWHGVGDKKWYLLQAFALWWGTAEDQTVGIKN